MWCVPGAEYMYSVIKSVRAQKLSMSARFALPKDDLAHHGTPLSAVTGQGGCVQLQTRQICLILGDY